MKIDTTKMNFHSTFKPQLIYVSRLLKLAGQMYSGDERSISDITGIPTGESSGKVVPHLYYAKFMGLIDFVLKDKVYNLSLTNFGKIVLQEDPNIIEDITKVILNYNIADISEGAPHWSYLYRVFNWNYNQEYNIKNIQRDLEEYTGKNNCKMIVVKKSYESECFENLRIINIIDKDTIMFNEVFPRIELYNAYAYTLIKDMEKYYPDLNEITIDEIIDEMKWNKPLGLSFEDALEVLDELSDLGYIKLNKQLTPMTNIRLTTSEELLERIYGFLL